MPSPAPELPLVVARNSENRGFGAACNQGANLGRGIFLLFLKPGCAPHPGRLGRGPAVSSRATPSRYLRHCAGARGRIGPAILLSIALGALRGRQVSGDGSLHPGDWSRATQWREWAHDETRQVGHVIGAFYLVRRTVFDALSGFDERFFVYLEDLDFSARAAALGWESWFLAGPAAFHRGGGTSEQAKSLRLFYALRSRLQYSSKHFSRFGAAAVWVSTLLAEPIARTADALFHRSWGQFSDTLRAYRSLWGWAISHKRLRG